MSVNEEASAPAGPFATSVARAALARGLAIARGGNDRDLAQRTALTAYLIRLASAAVAYVSQVLLARWMGGFEYGVFVFVWIWVLVGGSLATLGLNTSVLRFVPEYLERSEGAKLRGFLRCGRLVVLASSTLLAGLGVAGVYAGGAWLESYYILPLYLILICLPLFALTDFHDGVARSRNWVDLALGPPYLLRPLLLVVVMAAALGLGYAADAATAAVAAIVATWATGVVQWGLLARRMGDEFGSGERRYETGLWLRVSLPFVLVEGFYLLLSNTDILVLSAFVAPDQVAVYFAAVKTMGLMSFVAFAVSAAATHKFSEYNANGDREKLAAFVRDAVAWTFWPSLAIGGIILAVGYPLLWLFGPQFTSGYGLMFVLAAGLLARSTVGPVENLLNMMGQQVACALALVATVAVNLSLNLLLIPQLGLYGAAIATSSAVVVEAVLLCVLARRRLGIDVLIWNRPTQAKTHASDRAGS